MPELSGRLCMQPVAEKKKIAVLCGSNHKPHNMNVAVCRVKEAGERTYHIVFSPGNGLICRDTQDYILFQNFIAFAVLRDGCMLLAYAVMSTHAHIAVVTAWPWSFIHRLRTSYTTYFNKKYRRKGSVCGKQVYCMPVDGWYAQKALVSYILRNPMHHGVAGTPFGYRHTSLGAYFRKELSMADTQRDTSEDGNPGFDEHPGLNGNPGPRGCPRSKPKEDPGSKGKAGVAEKDGGPCFVRMRTSEGFVDLPVETCGRVRLEYFVNAGRTEHLFRTARTFLHSMVRWNTEDWEKEQANEASLVTLRSIEPDPSFPIEQMRAYENGSFRPGTSDEEVCGYVDHTVLPQMGLGSFVGLDPVRRRGLVSVLMKRFHISAEQALRCLGG